MIASWHWLLLPKEIVSPQPTPPKVMVSPLATSLENVIVSPVATLLLPNVIVTPLLTVAVFERVIEVDVFDTTVVLAEIPVPVTVMPVCIADGTEVKFSLVLLFVTELVASVTVVPTLLDSVTVFAVNPTTVVPEGIAALLVVSVTPMPTAMFAGTAENDKTVVPTCVAALVLAEATLVPTTALESVTVVEVVDTTAVHAAIAEELVLS